MLKSEIKSKLENIKIFDLQFDLNGVCNANCWFCPVKYEIAPSSSNMKIDDVRKILDDILSEKGKIIDLNFNHIYTAHYNEILLYPYLEEFLELLRERNLKTMILSNGTTAIKRKIDILKKYNDVLSGINFNIPAITKDQWKIQAGFDSDKLYERLIENLKYSMEVFPERIINKTISVVMNGVGRMYTSERGGFIRKLDNFPKEVTEDILDDEFFTFSKMFPGLHIYKNQGIIDRDGLLEKHNIISTKEYNRKHNRKGSKVISCRNGFLDRGGRLYGWLHINSMGDVFICCQDYSYGTKFGNILDKNLRDIWFSDEHINMIKESLNGFCLDCSFAQWGD